jgi:hypothetical protein
LRTDEDNLNKNKNDLITTEMGENLAKEIGALFFLEVSAWKKINIDLLFDKIFEQVELSLGEQYGKKFSTPKNKKCLIF